MSELNKLNKHMFTSEFIQQYSSKTNPLKINPPKTKPLQTNHPKPKQIEKVDKIYPSYTDKLFWCFFIINKGLLEYEMINKNHFTIEKQIKIDSVEKIETIKDKLKISKLKIINIENEMCNESKISLIGLHYLCILHKLNMVRVKNNTMYDMMGNPDDEHVHVLYDDEYIDTTKILYSEIQDKYWKISNIKKPINAISAYTIVELTDICNKLKIETTKDNKKLLKKELYDEIIKKLQ